MQYVRSLSGSVTKTWNSINPATLSGAIDVVVVEQEDGSLACSPFHVRFGKFSLLRPSEKKVEFKVNEIKQDYSMKLGEGGEAFFVFETSDEIPEGLQTSPLVSPAASPESLSSRNDLSGPGLQEPEFLDLSSDIAKKPTTQHLHPDGIQMLRPGQKAQSDLGNMSSLSSSPVEQDERPKSRDWSSSLTKHPLGLDRAASEELLPVSARPDLALYQATKADLSSRDLKSLHLSEGRPSSPPPSAEEAVTRAIALSKKLHGSNIPTHVTDAGDLMLDMHGYKSSEEDAMRAELIARKILSEEFEGNDDIGALIGADDRGNLWIFSSEEAKEAAARKLESSRLSPSTLISDASSDPGYHTDDERSLLEADTLHKHADAEASGVDSVMSTPLPKPKDPPAAGDPNRNYAKTLRLTSTQLRALNLKHGPNSMSFSVNRATCQANMYYWTYDVPVVISDIDGTITKYEFGHPLLKQADDHRSDALGHVLNMIGRDWTHIGVAKLYTDIVANGYNILYLTSRSVGQADTTRTYLDGVVQDGHKLPKGPVILSPDRTIAALRREIYLRKPEVFKMACLRDILNLFAGQRNPFYAGFGNRLTDALSYRSVNIPSTRIFTINSDAEVSLDLLTLTKYKSSYVTMREVVDHFFPPVGLLVPGGGEKYTDFSYWRDAPLDSDQFSASDDDGDESERYEKSVRSEDEGSMDDDEEEDVLAIQMENASLDEGDPSTETLEEDWSRESVDQEPIPDS